MLYFLYGFGVEGIFKGTLELKCIERGFGDYTEKRSARYGDIYPVSTLGRVITMLSSIFGIAIVALPAGIITAGYMSEIERRRNEKEIVECATKTETSREGNCESLTTTE